MSNRISDASLHMTIILLCILVAVDIFILIDFVSLIDLQKRLLEFAQPFGGNYSLPFTNETTNAGATHNTKATCLLPSLFNSGK